ncbi:hypothetical protein EJ04DRAFT_446296 [Polyplosphaeria fusca]|uniref:Uncharacterized protein n=1 Tax=Polyplosphaeria fusca TaxID=682080 RepID=A0A9P4QM52_9PLEO|nr:hypothetical protein EJ04DRAFT_446296 [Polyplosphaeria fusca]
MPSLPALTIYGFALPTFISAIITLTNPALGLDTLALSLEAAPAIKASSLGAIAVSLYYTLAAYQENRLFFKLTIPMRLFTTSIVWNMGPGCRSLGWFEGLGALATGLALLLV